MATAEGRVLRLPARFPRAIIALYPAMEEWFFMSRMGDTIRGARLQAKMTEKALGKKCGMAENVIKDIESGRRIVSDDQAQRILKILGVKNPVSEELEVAAEPDVPLRPRPRPYKLPTSEAEPQPQGDKRRLAGRAGRGGQARAGDGREFQRGRPRAGARGGWQDRGRRAGQGVLLPLPGRRPCAATASLPVICCCACRRRRWRTGLSPCFS